MNDFLRSNFKKIRKEANISQEQMANFLGLEQSIISKFENGERTINTGYLEKACALFGVTLHELYSNSGEISILSPSFRKSCLSSSSLEAISEINKIALNILEMSAILDQSNG